MRTDEQIAPSLDPLDGFLISGTRARSDSPRLIDLWGFLASPPIPNEPRPAQEESGDAPDAKVPSLAASVDGARQETRSRTSMDEDRRMIGAVTVEPPRVKAGISESLPAPRTIASEAASLAAAEPRALVAASDVLVQFGNRFHEANGRGGEEDSALLGTLLDGGGLADPSVWLSAVSEPSPSRDSIDGASTFGYRPSGASTRRLSAVFDRGRSDRDSDRDLAPISRADRYDDSSTESLEEIEARLSRAAARLEGAVERIESTPPPPLGSRMGGFRGRVDE